MRRRGNIIRWMPIGVFLLAFLMSTTTTAETARVWPQFRGANCSGIGAVGAVPPIQFGPETNVLWKTSVPPGHSSPCIWEDRIFITAFEKKNGQMYLLCLDRMSGEIQWQQPVPAKQIERVHSISNPATATPATDGNCVYAYFASYGLLAYDSKGNLMWKVPLPIPKTRFGSGTSPVIAGDLVILNRDEQREPCLIAVDRHTGRTVWKTPQRSASEMGATSYSAPVLWADQVVIHRTGEIVAYSLEKGERVWSVSAVTMGTSTPVIGGDFLFVGTWSNFGEPELRVDLPDFGSLVGQYDSNGDRQLSRQEFPRGLALARHPEVGNLPGGTVFLKPFFNRIDGSGDGHINDGEWKEAMTFVSSFYKDHGLMAIRLGEETDTSDAYVAWHVKRNVPEVPSPLYYDRRVYMIKNGGVISCMDAQKGTLVYQERLGASGPYYSSPILAGDRIYTASAKGIITVLAAGDQFQILARNDLGESIFATPAAVEDTLYIRSSNHVYAFAEKDRGNGTAGR